MGYRIDNKFTTPGLLNLGKNLIIDTETGGEDAQEHSILSLAAVVWKKGKILDAKEWFICEQPEPIVKQSALNVNHIDYDWICQNGLTPKEAFNEFEAFLTKWFGGIHFNNAIRLMGHNLPFDIAFLRRLLALAEVHKRGYDWFQARFQKNHIDTVTEVIDLIEAFGLPYPSEKFPNLKLGSCLEFFGIDVPENRHQALVDAALVGDLYTKILKKVNPFYPNSIYVADSEGRRILQDGTITL